MNPSREGPQPNFENYELPPLSPEDEPGLAEQGHEAPAARPETVGERPAAPALPTVPTDIPAADQPVIAAPPQDATIPVTDPQTPAHDKDRIEKQWVDKAKAVIARTQDDPYLQKDEMSKVKAEYIQKRFNKIIKTDEAAA